MDSKGKNNSDLSKSNEQFDSNNRKANIIRSFYNTKKSYFGPILLLAVGTMFLGILGLVFGILWMIGRGAENNNVDKTIDAFLIKNADQDHDLYLLNNQIKAENRSKLAKQNKKAILISLAVFVVWVMIFVAIILVIVFVIR